MEAKRVLGSRVFLAALGLLVLVSLFFFLYRLTGETGDLAAYSEAYHQTVTELQALTPREALDRCEEKDAAISQAQLRGDWKGTPEELREQALYQQLQGSYEYLLGYGDYLKGIQTDAKKLQGVSLFSDPDSPAYRNIVKTARDFATMENVPVTPGHDLAVTEFFADGWGDYSILILMALVCGLLVAERREGLWSLVHAAPGGRKRLVLNRVGVLFAAAWIGTLAILGSKLLLCGWVFHGLGEWDRTLQSIPMFQNVPTPMTLWQFWGLYLTVKAMGAFWIGLALWAMLSAISNMGLALGVTGLALAGEYACTLLPSASALVLLRYVNLFSYVDYGKVFPRYLNLPLFGGLISGNDLILWMLVPLCALFVGVNLWLVEAKKPVAPPNPILTLTQSLGKRHNPRFAGGGELCKLLIKRRGILLLALLAVLVVRAEEPPRAYVPWDPYIQYYQEAYAGPVTPALLETLEADLAQTLDSNHAAGLTLVLEQARELPPGAWLLPTAPYDAVFSDNLGNYHRSTALMALLFLVLAVSPIASQERQFQMVPLLRAAPGGRKRLFVRKQLLLFGVAAAVWALVYGGELWKVVDTYGAFRCLSAPAYSIEPFQSLGWSLPLGWALGLYYIWKLGVLLAAGEVCCFLSARCQKNRDAMLLCTAILVLPGALAAIGSRVGEFLSFLLPLSTVEWLFV